MMLKPSCLISCSHPGPASGTDAGRGRHGSMNFARGRERRGGGMALLTAGAPRSRVAWWSQQLRQLGDVDGDTPRLFAGHQVRRRAPAGLVLEIDVGERVALSVPDDVAVLTELHVGVIDGPGGGKRRTGSGYLATA